MRWLQRSECAVVWPAGREGGSWSSFFCGASCLYFAGRWLWPHWCFIPWCGCFSVPFHLAGIAVGGVLELVRAIFLPVRIIRAI